MKVFHTPAVRRLLLLAVLLATLFFMQPVQQTAYALGCCSRCGPALELCESGCDVDDGCIQRCLRLQQICERGCSPLC